MNPVSRLIIAVDFDLTLTLRTGDVPGYVAPEFPTIGKPRTRFIEELRHLRAQGHRVILWTCRANYRDAHDDDPLSVIGVAGVWTGHLQAAVDWCHSYDLEFDAVNANLPDVVAYWGNDGRKISADIYIDDKGVGPARPLRGAPESVSALYRCLDGWHGPHLNENPLDDAWATSDNPAPSA